MVQPLASQRRVLRGQATRGVHTRTRPKPPLPRLTLHEGAVIGLGVAFPPSPDSPDDPAVFFVRQVLSLELKQLHLWDRVQRVTAPLSLGRVPSKCQSRSDHEGSDSGSGPSGSSARFPGAALAQLRQTRAGRRASLHLRRSLCALATPVTVCSPDSPNPATGQARPDGRQQPPNASHQPSQRSPGIHSVGLNHLQV